MEEWSTNDWSFVLLNVIFKSPHRFTALRIIHLCTEVQLSDKIYTLWCSILPWSEKKLQSSKNFFHLFGDNNAGKKKCYG